MIRKIYFLICWSFLASLLEVLFSFSSLFTSPFSSCPSHSALILIPFLLVVLGALLSLPNGRSYCWSLSIGWDLLPSSLTMGVGRCQVVSPKQSTFNLALPATWLCDIRYLTSPWFPGGRGKPWTVLSLLRAVSWRLLVRALVIRLEGHHSGPLHLFESHIKTSINDKDSNSNLSKVLHFSFLFLKLQISWLNHR